MYLHVNGDIICLLKKTERKLLIWQEPELSTATTAAMPRRSPLVIVAQLPLTGEQILFRIRTSDVLQKVQRESKESEECTEENLKNVQKLWSV